MLNDLLGIQSRGGCSCAGPYGHRLLGIDIERSHSYERQISLGCEGIKPGWVRVSFNYFISEAVFDYLLAPSTWLANDGWKLLPDYRFDPGTGIWRHRDGPAEAPLSLHAVRYDADGVLRHPGAHRRAYDDVLETYLDEARRLLAAAPVDAAPPAELAADFDALRWFELPRACVSRTERERTTLGR